MNALLIYMFKAALYLSAFYLIYSHPVKPGHLLFTQQGIYPHLIGFCNDTAKLYPAKYQAF